MLRVETFTFNAFSENTYLLRHDAGECWIIDPGMGDTREQQAFKNYLASEGLKPKAILNTHAHIDHVLGVDFLVETYGIPFYLHPLEAPVLAAAGASAAFFGFAFGGVRTKPLAYNMDAPLQLGEDSLQLLLTPGHSPGSISFYSADGGWVVGGDVLFAGGVGRTDLPGGDYETLIRSIREQLLVLPEETVVYPGHGAATTVGQEREWNPFLR